MLLRRSIRPGRQSVCARNGLILTVLAMLAAGCGGTAGPSRGNLAAIEPTTATTTTTAITSRLAAADGIGGATSTSEPEAVQYSQRRYEVEIDELAFTAGELPTTAPPPTTTTTPTTTAAASATTQGSGAAPVTTQGGGDGGDVSIYTGIVGSIGPDEVMAPAVADPPTVGAGILPLTGLPGEVPNHPAAVVKIDNGSSARPQTGLNAADIVIEEEVEGGITRFAAIFHSTATIVGPVRSGRTTDIAVLNGLGSPLLLYSGANQVTDALIRAQSNVQNRSAATSSGYWRSSSRRAPSNLYSDTAPHWASANGGPPPPQFAYRAEGAPVGGVEATSIKVAYRASSAAWSWDGSAWLRTQGGRSHMTAGGQRVSAANVVVIEASEVATGMVDGSGSNVPEFVFVGTGRATVFTAGRRIEGVWTRPTLRSVATLTTAEGAVIELTPGRTWIELIGAGSGLLK